jgi:hypothetical protein
MVARVRKEKDHGQDDEVRVRKLWMRVRVEVER